MRPFRIGRTPVTNATFLTFAEGGGYQRREWWSDEGWSWKEDYDITHPGGWAAGPDGWRQWRIDGWAPLHPDEPVVHVSWFEADALARSLGARLPTEAEWEKAATWDQERGRRCPIPWGDEPAVPGDGRANLDQTGLGPQPAGSLPAGAAPSGALGMLGDTWEWTSTALPRLSRLHRRTRTASTPRCSSARTTASCAAARGRRARTWRRRRSATGTCRSGARSSPACGWRGTPRDAASSTATSTPTRRGRWPRTCSTASRARPRSWRPSTSTTRAARSCSTASPSCPEYYPTRAERAILEAEADAIVAATRAGELVELGSGTAAKTRVLLDAMARAGHAAALRAVRRRRAAGPRRRGRAGRRVPRPRGPRRGRRLRAPPRRDPAGAARLPRIVAFLGGTIGNFPPGSRRRFLRSLGGAARRRRLPAARHRPRQGPARARGGLRRQRRGDGRVQPQRAARPQPRARRRLRPRAVRPRRVLRPGARVDRDAAARPPRPHASTSPPSTSTSRSPAARSCGRRSRPSSRPSASPPTSRPPASSCASG